VECVQESLKAVRGEDEHLRQGPALRVKERGLIAGLRRIQAPGE